MFAVSVSGVVLLFLLQHSTLNSVNGQNIDSNTLARIFTFFEQNYKILKDGIERQYAVAINVPMKQCQAGFTPTKDNFLTEENSEEVKRNISKSNISEQDPVYEGTDLKGAGTKVTGSYNIHSERLLFNPEGRNTSRMEDLLNKSKDDSCTVFYTLNSPCASICLNENKTYNILHGLETWSAHPSIKALVFKQIWRQDRNVFEAALRKIVKYVPVYRCISKTNENVCYACGGKDDAPIDKHCLSN